MEHRPYYPPKKPVRNDGVPLGMLGKAPIIGKLTDDEIVSHYIRQARDGFGRQAIEELIRTENKTPSELLKILHSRGVAKKFNKEDFTMGKPVYDTAVKEQVIKEKQAGVPAKEIAQATGLTPKQVENIFTAYKEKQKQQSKANGSDVSVNDLPAVPVSEEEPSGFAVSVQDIPAVIGTPVRFPVKPLNIFAVLLAMQQFVGAVAEGAEITEAAAAGSDAHVSFSYNGANYGLEMKRLDS